MSHLRTAIILSQVPSGIQLLIPLTQTPHVNQSQVLSKGGSHALNFTRADFLLSLQKGSVSPSLYEDNGRVLMGHFSFSVACFA